MHLTASIICVLGFRRLVEAAERGSGAAGLTVTRFSGRVEIMQVYWLGAIPHVTAVTRNTERLLCKSPCRKLPVEKRRLHTHPAAAEADWYLVTT